MKKIIALVISCFAAMIIVFIPALKALNNSYSVNRFNKEISMKFLTSAENGHSVNAENNGKKYIVASANYSRLNDLLTYSKRKIDDIPSVEGKDIIKLRFNDGSEILIVNYDEENDVAYILNNDGNGVTCYTVTDLNLYNWVNEVVDDDGFRVPNKILPN